MLTSTRIIRKKIKKVLSPVYDPTEADQVAALIIEYLFGVPTTSQLLDNEVDFSRKIEPQYQKIINRLLQHEPIQYVLGYTEFYGQRFKTDSRALIPRPETEELVDYILSHQIPKDCKVLDIGSGTGCISITLALQTGCTVFALDVDREALALTRENAQALGADIKCIRADLFSTPPRLPLLDFIISNPPYVPQGDLGTIDSRVKNFEPSKALFVPDHNPLIFYERIAQLAPGHLVAGGQVFLEIYHLSGPEIMALFKGSQWSQVNIKKDLQGKDRMIKATLKS